MVLLIGFKGILSLRVFKNFRTLIEAVKVGVQEMRYFISLMFLLASMFAILNFIIEEKPFNQKNFYEALGERYRVVFGENPDMIYTSDGILNWIFYFLFTVIVNIIMLNLLIQLISDSYAQCQANEKSTDANAMINMLLEVGALKRVVRRLGKASREREEGEVYFVHRFVPFRGRGNYLDDQATWQVKLSNIQNKQDRYFRKMS